MKNMTEERKKELVKRAKQQQIIVERELRCMFKAIRVKQQTQTSLPA